MQRKTWSAALAILAALALSGTASAQAKKQLVIGSTSSSSSVFVYFVSLAKAINQYAPQLNATVVETGATVDNLRRIDRGQIDIGLATEETAASKFAGTDPFKGAAFPKLRTLVVFDDLPNMWVVRADAGVHALSDLSGKSFNAGINGSSTEFTTNLVLNALGIKVNGMKGSTQDAVSAIEDRRIVGYVKAGWRDASILNVMATTKVNFLSFTPQEEQTIKTVLPPGMIWFTVPKDTYQGMPAVRTYGFAVGVVATTALSTEEGYAILKAHEEGFKDMAAAYPDIAGKNLWTKTVETSAVYLHAGTVRFLREKGIAIPAKLIPPEAK